ncbi:hypothetical protein KAX14_04885 [Candidatus Bipolaricaulota bacterium]|nr:hypothetical protein [Candidatus Bipolaricaulota bacterium]
MSFHIPVRALNAPREFTFLAGIGSCLGIAGNYYLSWVHVFPCHGDEEAARELIEDAWISVGDNLRHALGALPEEDSNLDNSLVSVFNPHAK